VDTTPVSVVALDTGVRIVTPVNDPTEVVRALSRAVEMLAPWGTGWMIPGIELEAVAMSEAVRPARVVEGVPVWIAIALTVTSARMDQSEGDRMVVGFTGSPPS